MSNAVNITIRLDKDIKNSAEHLFGHLGMTLSTAFNVFVRQALRLGKIPFEISDPFYSDANQQRLLKSIAEFKTGKIVKKTQAELEAMENA
ncbi:DNA-damage-inducible protein J [Candidatus Termititenax aidoneus]|uniref:DNA-damage-inducible protein J n=1 Tax=Termititenax aidoneus TaxID=2218524 RepID=A0A388TFJ8_TERA1|nr:DNA-damage-inducible protein J [Candidatus Termititenax aidoneus]